MCVNPAEKTLHWVTRPSIVTNTSPVYFETIPTHKVLLPKILTRAPNMN